jgi:hypothetical protein
VRRLVGYVASPPHDAGAASDLERAALVEIDIRELARQISAYGLPDLPWQISGESLAQMGPPNIAYPLGDALVLLSNPEAPQVAVRALLIAPQARRQGQAARLRRALLARYPQKTWRVPALCPEEAGGPFEKAGFERSSLSQLQMTVEWSYGRSLSATDWRGARATSRALAHPFCPARSQGHGDQPGTKS